MKKVILIFLQKVFVSRDNKEVWTFSSKERKPVSLFGERVGGITFNEYIPGSTASASATIHSSFFNKLEDSMAELYIDANGSNRFYLIIDEQGAQAVVTEEQGLAVNKEQMQGSSIPQQPQAVAE